MPVETHELSTLAGVAFLEIDLLSPRVGVIKIVIVINCNLITFSKVITYNCN